MRWIKDTLHENFRIKLKLAFIFIPHFKIVENTSVPVSASNSIQNESASTQEGTTTMWTQEEQVTVEETSHKTSVQTEMMFTPSSSFNKNISSSVIFEGVDYKSSMS